LPGEKNRRKPYFAKILGFGCGKESLAHLPCRYLGTAHVKTVRPGRRGEKTWVGFKRGTLSAQYLSGTIKCAAAQDKRVKNEDGRRGMTRSFHGPFWYVITSSKATQPGGVGRVI